MIPARVRSVVTALDAFGIQSKIAQDGECWDVSIEYGSVEVCSSVPEYEVYLGGLSSGYRSVCPVLAAVFLATSRLGREFLRLTAQDGLTASYRDSMLRLLRNGEELALFQWEGSGTLYICRIDAEEGERFVSALSAAQFLRSL